MKKSIIFTALIFSGCITASYHRSNVAYRNAHREFNTASSSSVTVYRGRWGGIREIKGEKYHYLQFEGILKGNGRYLDVTLPVKGRLTRAEKLGPDGLFHETDTWITRPGDVIFRESSKAVVGAHPAYLIFQMYSAPNMDAFYALHNQKAGQESDPAAIMQNHFHYGIKDPKFPLALVKLDFTLNYNYSARSLVWDRDKDGKTRVICEGIDVDSYDGPRLAVEWKERSRLVYGLRQAGYAGTVIADVVTSPVQLVMLLLTGLAGPGVR